MSGNGRESSTDKGLSILGSLVGVVAFVVGLPLAWYGFMDRSPSAERSEFGGVVREVNLSAVGNGQLVLESGELLLVPYEEGMNVRVGDYVVKARGVAKPTLFRGESQQVPSAYWNPEPMEWPGGLDGNDGRRE